MFIYDINDYALQAILEPFETFSDILHYTLCFKFWLTTALTNQTRLNLVI